MKRVLLFIMLAVFVNLQHISSAEIWVEQVWNDEILGSEQRIVSDSMWPEEIYLGSFGVSESYLFSLDYVSSINPNAVVEQVSPILAHDVMFRLQTESPSPDGYWSIMPPNPPPYGSADYDLVLYHSNFEPIGTFLRTVLDSYIYVKADGPYTIGPGQTLSLNAMGHFMSGGPAGWVPDYDPLSTDDIGYDSWFINSIYGSDSIYIPSNVSANLSYDYLTTQLGLSEGVYDLIVYTVEPGETIPGEPDEVLLYEGEDYTTLTIVPEPVSILLLSLGGLLIRKR